MTASLVPALLITASALGGAPRGEVLNFSATWCGPCQQVASTVSRLKRQGYAIRKVDIDQERGLADQYGITSIPAFVLVVDGREVTRVTGYQSEEQLRRLLMQIPTDPPPVATTQPARSQPAYTQSSQPPAGQSLVSLNEPSGLPTTQAPQPQAAPQQRPAHTQPTLDATHPPADQPAKTGSLIGKLLGRNPQPQQPPVVRGNFDDEVADENLLPVRDPVAASVRLHVTIDGLTSGGSGTAVDSRPGRTVIVTCGHLFKNWNEQAKVEVDVFANGRLQKYVARMINYDVEADVGIVTIPTDAIIATADVPDVDSRAQTGDAVVNIGCSGGATPTQEAVQVTALNYFQGPDNIECTGVPVQGRSGGGLFDQAGQLVGVCIGADSERQRGAYAGLLAIHDQLDAAGLTGLYRRSQQPAAQPAAVAATPPSATNDFESFAHSQPAATPQPAAVTPPVAAASEAAMAAVNGSPDAEVICIIRDKSQPGTPSRVVIIDRASPSFLSYLSGEVSDPTLTQTSAGPQAGAVQTNRVSTSQLPMDPPRITDPQTMFHSPAASRPLFPNPGGSHVGERSRTASLQPTAFAESFKPQRYVRTR